MTALNYNINLNLLIENNYIDKYNLIPSLLTYIEKISFFINTLEEITSSSDTTPVTINQVQRTYVIWNVLQIKKLIREEIKQELGFKKNLSKKQLCKNIRLKWDFDITSILSYWNNLLLKYVKHINVINFILYTSTKSSLCWWCVGYCFACMKTYDIIDYYFANNDKYFNYVYLCKQNMVYCWKCIMKFNYYDHYKLDIVQLFNFDIFNQEHFNMKEVKYVINKKRESQSESIDIFDKYNILSNSELKKILSNVKNRLKNVNIEVQYLKNVQIFLKNKKNFTIYEENDDNKKNNNYNDCDYNYYFYGSGDEDKNNDENIKINNIQKSLESILVNYSLFIPYSTIPALKFNVDNNNDDDLNFGISCFKTSIMNFIHQAKWIIEKCRYKCYLYDKVLHNLISYHDDHVFSDSCVVCLQNYNFPFVTLTVCQHRICKMCFDKLTTTSLKCPICRRSIISVLFYTMDFDNKMKKHLIHYT
ncbi:MAG: Zinc/RING finger domain-containing protein [Cotesia congregata filamentous virus 2]